MNIVPIKSLLILASIISFSISNLNLSAQSWNQVGLDINGENDGDNSGISVSMPDANTVAIGSTSNSEVGNFAGHVRVYEWDGDTWLQKGLDIDGEAAVDNSGISVSMPDANTVAIGAIRNDGNGSNAGHTRIFEWNGSAWAQKGTDIEGEMAGDESGISISMPDASTIAIGAHMNDGIASNAGHVRVFQWIGQNWIQKGIDIDGESAQDRFGTSVSMPDANNLAVGATLHDGAAFNSGCVRTYFWNGLEWIQKGEDIEGVAENDQFGVTASMPDGNTVAAGSVLNDGADFGAGHVRIHEWDGSAWVQKGADLEGQFSLDRFGASVSMADSNTLAIGANLNDDAGTDAGQVQVFEWDGTAWVQKGLEINGEAAGDESGFFVAMPDTNTVAIGAIANMPSGHVRIYQLEEVIIIDSIEENSLSADLNVYPNPSLDGLITIELGKHYNLINAELRDALGKEVFQREYSTTSKLQLSLTESPGIYFLTLTAESEGSAIIKLTLN